jgi:glycosyltransferase involved in cell wall biosynthesis
MDGGVTPDEEVLRFAMRCAIFGASVLDVMKIVIQIPCFNEETTLAETLRDLPREIPGAEEVEWLVIDDGSTDSTAEVARRNGVRHVLRLPRNQGLARAFMAGLEESIGLGADIIVNTDADNQYDARDIPRLVEPILRGEADIVVGARAIAQTEHFSPTKKVLQRLGTWVIGKISHTPILDATSGFRALSRKAALRLNVFSEYTYTLETIIQAGHSNLVLTSVPVGTNRPTRESRLVRSIPDYLRRSLGTMFRIFVLYQPFRFFVMAGGIVFLAGFLLGLRFVYYYLTEEGAGHVQSLILSAVLLITGFQLWILGIVADLIATNRRVLEELRFRLRSRDLSRDERK